MNQVQINTNVKGQFVIPIAMRKYWGITPNTPLDIVNIPNIGILIRKARKEPLITKEEVRQILTALSSV